MSTSIRLALVFAPALAASTCLTCSACSSPGSAGAIADAGPGRGTPPAPPTPAAARPWPSPPGIIHPVFSLADNRLLAHLVRDAGLLVPLGGGGVTKYLHFGRPYVGWDTGAREDGHSVANLVGRPAHVVVPLTAAQAATRRVFLRLKTPAAQRLRVRVNEHWSAPLPLLAGWQTVALELPEKVLIAGENTIQLAPTSRLAVEWIAVATGDPGETVPLAVSDGKGGLLLPRGGGLAYYVAITPGTALAGKASSQGNCLLRVRATPGGAGAASASAASMPAPTGGAFDRVGPASGRLFLDLAPLADRVVRLELLAEGGGDCRVVTLRDTALTQPGPAPEVKYPARPRNVILWMADSLRADKVPSYNPTTYTEMPTMDVLIQRGIGFWTYVQGNESRASQASLWTGVYPRQHGMIADKKKLPPALPNIPRVVRPSGLYTAAITANGYISKFWGFGENWSFFRNNLHEGGGILGGDMAKHAISFLDKNGARPFLLFVGTIDGHVSWRGREPWISRYDREPYNGPFTTWCAGPTLEKIVTGKLRITDRDRRRILHLYESALSFMDHHFGTVLARLKGLGHAEDTMVIVTADHGDEFWEHERVGHGGSLRQTLVQVPLIISYPPLFPAHKVVEGTETIDILPTIADALGVPIPDNLQGESLIPLAQGVGVGYPRPSIASQYELAHAMRLGRYKLFVGGINLRLHDVIADPMEKIDLVRTRPVEMRHLTDAFAQFAFYQTQWRKRRHGVVSNHRPAFADEVEAGLLPPPGSGPAKTVKGTDGRAAGPNAARATRRP